MKRFCALLLTLCMFVVTGIAAESWFCSDCEMEVNGNFCSNCGKQNTAAQISDGSAFKLEVDFKENIVFSKYDVDLLIDGKKQDVIGHGEHYANTFNLSSGVHTIRFVSVEKDNVYGSVIFNANKGGSLKCEISAYRNRVEIDSVNTNTDYIVSGQLGTYFVGLKSAYTQDDVLFLVFDFSHNENSAQAFYLNIGVDCFQKGISCDPAYSFSETNSTKEIKKGVTIEVLHKIELDNTSPVEIEIYQMFSTDDNRLTTTIPLK